MTLDIRPTVDFVFKLLLGHPERTAITVHFLNAVLQWTPPIVSVQVLDPILALETDDDKLAILDVLAIDERGQRFNIEMQTSLPAGLKQRLLYYASTLYVGQLAEGDRYTKLRPAVTICVLERPLLTDTTELHSEFRLRAANGRIFSDDLQIHIVELSKSTATEDNIDQVNSLERWSYFLRSADQYSAEKLQQLLPEPEFKQAIGVLEMIARNPEERRLYDARLKNQRDQAAILEQALADAVSEARREEREVALAEGRQEGREIGVLIGGVRMLEEILGIPLSSEAELARMEKRMLESRIDILQRQVRERTP